MSDKTTTKERAFYSREIARLAEPLRTSETDFMVRLLAERDALENELLDTSHTCEMLELRAVAAETREAAIEGEALEVAGRMVYDLVRRDGWAVGLRSPNDVDNFVIVAEGLTNQGRDVVVGSMRNIVASALFDLTADRDAARAEVARLREAMAWYASPDVYGRSWDEDSEADDDGGQRARDALFIDALAKGGGS